MKKGILSKQIYVIDGSDLIMGWLSLFLACKHLN
jgi:hypothetical protein